MHDGHAFVFLLCLVAIGGFWCLATVGDLLVAKRVLHVPYPVVFSFDDSFCFGCFYSI
jgi:hypothetical protein